MLYCFVQEDLYNSDPMNSLMAQARFAKHLEKYCCCDLSKGIFTDNHGHLLELRGQQVFLRASCDTASEAMRAIQHAGGILYETPEDMLKIENWHRYNLTQRLIYESTLSKLLSGEVLNKFGNSDCIFIKTLKKGFSALIPCIYLRNRAAAIMDFLMARAADNDMLLISKALKIKKDYLGTKEARFVVLDGRITNGSRNLACGKHTVPHTLCARAQELVSIIGDVTDLPSNYVLDIALFCEGSDSFADLIELNPITTSLCYVNNSIFSDDQVDNIYGYGAEFFHDAVVWPDYYGRTASSEDVYVDPNHFDFS